MHELSEAEQAFVESNARFFEGFGLPRIGGRILALLLVADEPFTLDELAAKLRVSKASASTNLRHFITIGLVDTVTPLGDRKTYYQWSPKAWERRFEVATTVIQGVGAIAHQGLAAIGSENALAQERLRQSIEFAEYFETQLHRVSEGWKSRRSARPGSP
jgi:DNA-binding transcriptional regulator GbsR (MarR family)